MVVSLKLNAASAPFHRKHFPVQKKSHHSSLKRFSQNFILPQLLFQFQSIHVVSSASSNLRDSHSARLPSTPGDSTSDTTHPLSISSPTARLFRNAGLIGVATVTSKILGLLREIVLAAVFGVGPVATAFNHSSVFPGFFASLLGGVNGPIHITVSTTLSKLSKERRRHLIQNAHVVMLLGGAVLSGLVYMFSESIIYASAPGLWSVAENRITRDIAVTQLKLMTPCVLFAGPIGLGFGSLSAEGDHVAASLSPAISSIAIILMCAIYVSVSGSNTSHLGNLLSGGLLISCGASLGAFLQWFIQVLMHEKTGYEFASIPCQNILKDKDLLKLFALMLPATLSSGLAQLSSFTDLYFASFIPGAAASLSYASLLAMAPLGIILSTITLPLIPTFSTLGKQSSWPRLKESLQQSILLSMAIALPIASSICVLAEAIISVLFQRFAFDSAASLLVSSLLLHYSIGSPFYIIRELLVVVFYVLGDGKSPFLVSVAAILLNAFLDWLFIFQFGLGAQGLVLSTSLVTASSAMLFFFILSRKLTGLLDFTALIGPLLLLLACCMISAFTTLIAHNILGQLLSTVIVLRFCRLSELLTIFLASSLGMFGFFFPLVIFRFPGMKLVKDLLGSLIQLGDSLATANALANLITSQPIFIGSTWQRVIVSPSKALSRARNNTYVCVTNA